MKLIVGLGNPLDSYVGTRHNIGFATIEELAKMLGVGKWREQKKALTAKAEYKGEKLILAKPLTYMNLSGESIRPLSEYYKIDEKDVLVIVDDVNLEIGNIRARAKGSDGGHNGLKNIILHFGNENFPRIRVGVGAPKGDLAGHVLSKIPKEEQEEINKSVENAAKAALDFCEFGIDHTMNNFNKTQKKSEDEAK